MCVGFSRESRGAPVFFPSHKRGHRYYSIFFICSSTGKMAART